MKTIMFVANTSWFLYNFRLDIMLHMKQMGYRVIAVAPEDKYTERIIQNDIEHIKVKIDRKGKNVIHDLHLIVQLRKIYKRYQPEIIHHFTIKPSIYGSISANSVKIPRIANSITGLGHVFIKKNLIQFIVKYLYSFAFRNERVRVIFENPDDMNVFLKHRIIPKERAYLILGNGVDSTVFSPDNLNNACADAFHVKDDEIVFSLFARMIWNKGIREFVEAAKLVYQQNPKTRFFLIGDTDEGNPAGVPRRWLEAISKESFIQWIPHVDDVRPYMKRTDVIVLPSAYKEGVPQSLIESAFMCKPIVTTNIPGCREIVIDGKNGILVPPRDIPQLAKAMLKLSNDKTLREKMGKAGRQHAFTQFDAQIVIDKTKQVYFEE